MDLNLGPDVDQACPAWAIALLGGALAGSGPGTSPSIDGLSLVTGMVVPQHATCSNHADDGGCFGRPGTTRPISPVFWSWCAAASGGASQLGGQGPVGLPISHSWPNGSMILPMRQPCSSPTGDFWAAPASTAPPRLPRTTLRRRPAARRSRLPRLHGAAPLRQMPSGRTRAPGWPGRPTTPAGYSSWPGFSRSLGVGPA
jgi:hypothetical protein